MLASYIKFHVLVKEVDGIHCSTMRYGAVVVIAIVMLTVDRMECVENITIGCNSHCTLEFDKVTQIFYNLYFSLMIFFKKL